MFDSLGHRSLQKLILLQCRSFGHTTVATSMVVLATLEHGRTFHETIGHTPVTIYMVVVLATQQTMLMKEHCMVLLVN